MIMSDDAPTLLLAALRDEMDPVTAALGLSKYGSPRKGQVGGRQLIAMVTGMGALRMSAALEKALETHQPQRIILLGFSGGLSLAMNTGDVVRATCVLDGHGSAVRLDGDLPVVGDAQGGHDPRTTLLTMDRVVATPGDKQSLGKQHGATAVDMESFHVARIAAQRGVPLTIIRAISDPADFTMPARIGDWVREDGSPNIMAVLGALMMHPFLMGVLLRLRRHTKTAASRLAAEVMLLLDSSPARKGAG